MRAIVEGYAEGLWELPKLSGGALSMARHAPNFGFARTASDERFPYTAEVVAEFAGMPINRVKYALGALEAIEVKKGKPGRGYRGGGCVDPRRVTASAFLGFLLGLRDAGECAGTMQRLRRQDT